MTVKLDPECEPKGELKRLGGSKADEWNKRLNRSCRQRAADSCIEKQEQITEAALAVSYGTMDIAPADPIEGMLIAQLMAANEAALSMYRRGWAQPNECFDARVEIFATG